VDVILQLEQDGQNLVEYYVRHNHKLDQPPALTKCVAAVLSSMPESESERNRLMNETIRVGLMMWFKAAPVDHDRLEEGDDSRFCFHSLSSFA
jgi:hypothetical protein